MSLTKNTVLITRTVASKNQKKKNSQSAAEGLILDDLIVIAEVLAEITVPRKVKVWTFSMHSPCMKRGIRSALCFLESRMITLVFVVFRDRLFAEHHSDSFR